MVISIKLMQFYFAVINAIRSDTCGISLDYLLFNRAKTH